MGSVRATQERRKPCSRGFGTVMVTHSGHKVPSIRNSAESSNRTHVCGAGHSHQIQRRKRTRFTSLGRGTVLSPRRPSGARLVERGKSSGTFLVCQEIVYVLSINKIPVSPINCIKQESWEQKGRHRQSCEPHKKVGTEKTSKKAAQQTRGICLVFGFKPRTCVNAVSVCVLS